MALELEVDDSLEPVAEAVKLQRCILFLGAGVNAHPPEESPFEYPAERRPPIGSALSQELAGRCNLAGRFPREDPSNLQRVALFYEIARSRHQLVDAVTNAVQPGQAPVANAASARRAQFPARDHHELRPAVNQGRDPSTTGTGSVSPRYGGVRRRRSHAGPDGAPRTLGARNNSSARRQSNSRSASGRRTCCSARTTSGPSMLCALAIRVAVVRLTAGLARRSLPDAVKRPRIALLGRVPRILFLPLARSESFRTSWNRRRSWTREAAHRVPQSGRAR
jgi:hypothetical protein